MAVPIIVTMRHLCCAAVCITALLSAGCSLPDQNTPSELPDLGFQAEQDLSLITLSWSPVNVTGFKEYIILQSTEEIPESQEPEVNSGVTVLKRIDDMDITTFHASDGLNSTHTCYKLFVSIEDRFLQSGNICIEHNADFISGFYDRIAHDEGEGEIVMYDRNIIRLSTYDLEEGTIKASIPENFLSVPSLDVSTHNGVRYAFISDESNSTIRRFNMPDLNNITSKTFSSGIDALVSYGPYLFVALNISGSSFQVINRQTLTLIDSRPGLGPQPGRSIAVFPGDPLVVLEISPGAIHRYTLDNTGQISTQDVYALSTGTQSSLQSLTANSEHLFITGPQGMIIDRDAQVLGKLSNTANTFFLVSRITQDETRALALVNSGQTTELRIFDINDLQHIHELRTITLPAGTFSDLLLENNIAHVFGVTFDSGQPRTVILKYPLS